jgi:20S proteasome alpha/beta subunit
MTFIATVIAQKGAAIIADSLATLMEEVIFTNDLQEYINSTDEAEISMDGIYNLARRKPNYTKNYAEKLFQIDKFTALTTAGKGAINKKSIEALITEFQSLLISKNENYSISSSVYTVEDIVEHFFEFIKEQAGVYLSTNDFIDSTVFYITHFSVTDNSTDVYQITVGNISSTDFGKDPASIINKSKIADYQKVVCDGQNANSDRILYGELNAVYKIVAKTIEVVFKDQNLKGHTEYVEQFFKNHNLIDDFDLSDSIKIFKLNGLSLQQAVNLAALLMRIERDLQSFTEDIPNVGGVIKLAVIDKEGFRMIMGDTIETPIF